MNGRYFAGKQITCEFVGVTRWKVAICGEYMKSRLKTCSRGTACNFIHCFRNPGGDYEWADWDNPPPKHWVKKMAALFGPSVEAECHGHSDFEESEPPERSSRKTTTPADNRFYSRRSRHRERDFQDHGSDKDYSDGHEGWHSKQSTRKEHLNRRQMRSFHDGWDQPDRREYSKDGHSSSKHISRSCSSWENVSREKERDRLYKYRKYKENVSVCNERSSRDNNRSNSSGRGRMKTLFDDQRKPEMSQYPERYNGQSGSPDQDADEGHYNESRDKSSPSDEGSRSPAGICRNTSMEPHCEREFSHECRSDHDNNLDESKEFCEHHTKYHSRYTPVRDQDGSGRKETHFRSMHTGSNQSLSCIESEETCSSTTENSEDSHYCHRKKYNSRHKGSRHRKAYPAEDCGKDSDCADTDLRRSTSRKRSRSRTSHHSSSSRKRKELERFT